MTREKLLKAKTDQIQRHLEQWARDARILAKGEKIIISLRVETTSESEPAHEVRAETAPQATVFRVETTLAYPAKWLRPAQLSEDERHTIVGLIKGQRRASFYELLFTHNNQPTKGQIRFDRSDINTRLKRPINGKYYRIAIDNEACQLWELDGPPPVVRRPIDLWEKAVTEADWESVLTSALSPRSLALLRKIEAAGVQGLPTQTSEYRVSSSELNPINRELRDAGLLYGVRNRTPDVPFGGWDAGRIFLVHIERP